MDIDFGTTSPTAVLPGEDHEHEWVFREGSRGPPEVDLRQLLEDYLRGPLAGRRRAYWCEGGSGFSLVLDMLHVILIFMVPPLVLGR